MRIDIPKEEIYNLYIIQNYNRQELSQYYHCSTPVITRRLREYGITKDKSLVYQKLAKQRLEQMPDIPDDELRELYYVQNLGAEMIGKKYGLSKDIVKRILKDHRLSKTADEIKKSIETTRILKGQKSVLPVSDDELINEYLTGGESQITLSQKYNVGIVVIRKHLHGVCKDNDVVLKDAAKHQEEKYGDPQYSLHKMQDGICTNSFGEIDIANFLSSIGVSCYKDRVIIQPQEIDVYCPDYKLAIEFNGLYWHSTEFRNKEYHFNKTIECNKAGVRLIHIFEDDWVDKTKNKILKSVIKLKLNKPDHFVQADSCSIQNITKSEAAEFNLVNSLNNRVSAKINYGLFNNNVLIQTVGFSFCPKNNSWYITYNSTLLNTLINGGTSKILNCFIQAYNPKRIIANANIAIDESYDDCMAFVENRSPALHCLFYKGKPVEYLSDRYKQLKKEKELMPKIWDAGSKRYIWENPEYTTDN